MVLQNGVIFLGSLLIVPSLSDDLEDLGTLVVRMGGLAEVQLRSALTAVVRRDGVLATQVIGRDQHIDGLERDLQSRTLELLADPARPVDLNRCLCLLKIGGNLERIGDHAASIAKRCRILNALAVEPRLDRTAVPQMGLVVRQMLGESLSALVERDGERARAVEQRGAEFQALHDSKVRELLEVMEEDSGCVLPGTHMLFIARDLDRIVDHTTRVALAVWDLVASGPSRPVPAPAGLSRMPSSLTVTTEGSRCP